MKSFIVIMVTCASSKEARCISKSILKKRLAACATMAPAVESMFWWNGKINSAREILLLLKAPKANFAGIEKEVRRTHSYEMPEIIAVPVVAGSRDYLNWIGKEA